MQLPAGVSTVTSSSIRRRSSALPSGSNTIGNVGGLPVTSGGISFCRTLAAASTNATNCKASAAGFIGLRAINVSNTKAYLRTYNLAVDPTCSSATGFVETIPIPADTAGSGGAGVIQAPSLTSILTSYGTGFGYCVTGGGGNTDNTAPPAGVYITIFLQ